MSTPGTNPSKKSLIWLFIAIVGVTALATLAVVVLLVTIFEHKQEERNPFYRVVEITDNTVDPAIWGKDFPQQYDMYLRTVDQTRTKYGGSEALPHQPDNVDPRSWLAKSRLDEDPRLKTMYAGYSFAIDFRKRRGHAWMLDDQTLTLRQSVGQPGTCMNCHASMYTIYKDLGNGDLTKGFEKVNQMKYAEARRLATHPVACIDCHDPKTMALRVTRPAFMEAIARVKASQGIQNYNVNSMATRQEMRAYVCGQCHVEYYFKGPEKRLTYPWDNGMKADQILAYYQKSGTDAKTRFKDWTHGITGAPVLKAQHPEFETWNQGIHARSGVACADCHMPYKRVGALKISDHHVQSPLLNINNACQTCHKFSEQELKDRVEAIQDRTFEMRNRTMSALMDLIRDIKAEQETGGDAKGIAQALEWQRQAQFLLDFIESENSMGFHASQESARILSISLDDIRQGQMALRPLTPPARQFEALHTNMDDLVTTRPLPH